MMLFVILGAKVRKKVHSSSFFCKKCKAEPFDTLLKRGKIPTRAYRNTFVCLLQYLRVPIAIPTRAYRDTFACVRFFHIRQIYFLISFEKIAEKRNFVREKINRHKHK